MWQVLLIINKLCLIQIPWEGTRVAQIKNIGIKFIFKTKNYSKNLNYPSNFFRFDKLFQLSLMMLKTPSGILIIEAFLLRNLFKA